MRHQDAAHDPIDVESSRTMTMTHHISPQTSPRTNTAGLRLVRPAGGSPVREVLWTVEAEGERISCELRHHGRYGVEYRMFRDYEFDRGRGFRTRTLAVRAAALVRRQLENAGSRC